MYHGSNGKTRGLARRMASFLRDGKAESDEAASPQFEMLEARILLSANPLAELHDEEHAVPFADAGPATYMPMLAGQNGDAVDVTADIVDASPAVTILSPVLDSHVYGQVSVTAEIEPGEAAVASWKVRLVNEATGATYNLKTGTGQPASETLVTFSAGSYASGSVRIEVEVTDQAGNTTIASTAFNIDNYAPTASISSPSGGRQNGVFDIVGSVADRDTANELVYWNVQLKNNATGQTSVVATGVGVQTNAVLATVDAADFASGAYTVILEATDATGRVTTATRTTTLDGQAPSVSVSCNAESVNAGQAVTISITSSDDVGVTSHKLIVDGVTYNIGTAKQYTVRPARAGVIEIVAEAYDAAGNVGRATTQLTVNDVAAPTVSFNTPVTNKYFSESTDIYATIRDTDSRTVDVKLVLTSQATGERFVIGHVPAYDTVDATTNRLIGTFNPQAFADGKYTLAIEATDPAGHVGRAQATITIDTEPPVINSVTVSSNDIKTFTNIYFTINATDNDRVMSYKLTVGGVPVSVGGTGTGIYQFQEAGTYEIVATATDMAGNSTSYAFTVNVTEIEDVRAPIISLTPGDGTTHKNDIPVRVSISDSDSLEINWTVTLVDNATGATTVLGSGNRALSSTLTTLVNTDYAEGEYTIIAEAIDKGGNSTVVQNTFRIDRTAPDVEIEHTSRLETEQTIWFTVAATDVSGISIRRLTINGVNVGLDANGRGSYKFTSVGQYTLVATATDKAGNTATVTEVITVTENTDHIAPTVTIHTEAPHPYYRDSITVRATIDDVDTNDEDVTWTVRLLRLDGVAYQTVSGRGKIDNNVLTILNLAAIPTSECILEVTATDPAGHTSTASVTVNVVRLAPKITMEEIGYDYGDAHGVWVNYAKEIKGTITSPYMPDELVAWKVVATNFNSGTEEIIASGTGQPTDGVFTIFDPQVSGRYCITIVVEDIVGNSAQTYRYCFVDIAPPVVTEINYGSDGRVFQYAVFGSDDMSNVYGTLDVPARVELLDPVDGRGLYGSNVNVTAGLNFGYAQVGAVAEYRLSVQDWHGHRVYLGYFHITVLERGLRVVFTPEPGLDVAINII